MMILQIEKMGLDEISGFTIDNFKVNSKYYNLYSSDVNLGVCNGINCYGHGFFSQLKYNPSGEGTLISRTLFRSMFRSEAHDHTSFRLIIC